MLAAVRMPAAQGFGVVRRVQVAIKGVAVAFLNVAADRAGIIIHGLGNAGPAGFQRFGLYCCSGIVVAVRGDVLLFSCGALTTVVASYTFRCAGGLSFYCSGAPVVLFSLGDGAAAEVFPDVVFGGIVSGRDVRLPTARRAGVVGRVLGAGCKRIRLRALFAADAGLIIDRRRGAGRLGRFIYVIYNFLIIGVRGRIFFALADRALLPVLVNVSFPFAGPVVLARDELGGAAVDDRADGSAVVFVQEFIGRGIVLVS